jgi:O-methyltransferase involved in polyketide biosynthesis
VQAITFSPELSGVPETMLWTLHDRASETRRRDGVLHEPHCVSIYESIDYDFAANFGTPSRLASVRAAETDRVLRRWLAVHPHGLVVSLGEGLETQATRVDNGQMRWLTVDLPDAIRVRERFMPPTDRFSHLAMSAADLGWMDQVDDSAGVFIVAQGLFMYLQPEVVRRIFVAIADRFPKSEMVFDTVPNWFSQVTKDGCRHTRDYTIPRMPWGVDRNEIKPLLRSWRQGIRSIRFLRYRPPSTRPPVVEDILDAILPHRQQRDSLVHVVL